MVSYVRLLMVGICFWWMCGEICLADVATEAQSISWANAWGADHYPYIRKERTYHELLFNNASIVTKLPPLTDADIDRLMGLRDSLVKLTLEGNHNITAAGYAKLARFSILTGLFVRIESVSDREVTAMVKALPTLRTLDLAGTGVTDDGLKSISRLKDLKELGLAETKVTFEGLRLLKRCGSLRRLALDRVDGLSNDQIESLGAELKSVKIVH